MRSRCPAPPTGAPTVTYGTFNEVQVDIAGWASLRQYTETVDERTMRAAKVLSHSVCRERKQIAFFTAGHYEGCVPKTSPEVLRILETNGRILRGNAPPGLRFTHAQQQKVHNWVLSNAERLWVSDGCPLAPRSRGGASLIVVDDPHMAVLVTIAKKLDPARAVVYRSHSDVQPSLVLDAASNTAQVFNWNWSYSEVADVFIGHPIKGIQSQVMPKQRLGYMPATSDWLDSRNKPLSIGDVEYYLQDFNDVCRRGSAALLAYPERDYILQISHFHTSKSVADALAAYVTFRRHASFCTGKTSQQMPQLVLCSQYSGSNQDQQSVVDRALAVLNDEYFDLRECVVIVNLPPCDQTINALMSRARVALQLSAHEDCEVTVSEALKKGVPVITISSGGFPLLVRHNVNGFLIHDLDTPADRMAVVGYLNALFSNEDKYQAMSAYASKNVSVELGTVANALCWLFLADRLACGHDVVPNGRWIWDMARDHAGEPVGAEEMRLPRALTM
ncbi:hypothetical protein LTR81_027481 [Elasticomyces elasticus]